MGVSPLVLKNNKSLGQHWLNDRAILDAIADLATGLISKEPSFEGRAERGSASPSAEKSVATDFSDAARERTVLEIGPGLGTLTSSLLKRFNQVIAVEYDPRLAQNLPKSFPGKNLKVINEDFLKFDLSSIKAPYVAVGNIPYYITSPIITKLLDTSNQPQKIVLLIQKEVADRILEGPGRHTYLSLSVQSKAEVSPGFLVPKEYFTPPPKVDSAVIVMTPRQIPLLSPKALNLAKQGFKNPRKKLINNLPYDKSNLSPIFKELNISETARPAALDHETWQKLQNCLDKIKH